MTNPLSEQSRLTLLERESPFHNPSRSFRAELHPDNALPELASEAWSQEDASLEVAPLAETGLPGLEGETPLDRPADVPKLPSDTALRVALQKSKIKEVRALANVMKEFGKPNEFGQALREVLKFVPWEDEPGSNTFRIAFARIGVEAFLLGTTVPEENRIKLGFIDHPSRIADAGSPGQRQFFVHFAVEVLRLRAQKAMVPLQHRRELSYATALFSWVHADLAREYSTSGIPEALLVAYRRLLVIVISRHYQALQDALVTEMRRTPSSAAEVLKALKGHLDTAATIHLQDKHATVPTYHAAGKVYRDYFAPAAPTKIEYRHYTTGPLPMALKEFETPFRGLVRAAVRQRELIEELARLSGTRSLPSLHDTASWQTWLRGMWNETWRGPALERLQKVLKVVQTYSRAFTIQVPFDLLEGCKVDSYLTRAFPRAVTGARIHDCAVYAVRWLHMLGGIIGTKAPAAGVSKPKIFLIEMPAHVGVMIRLNLDGRELMIAFNNDHAEVHEEVDGEADDISARIVVNDMYRELKTPFVLRQLSADPTDAKALWKETCKIFDKKLALPYGGPAEPHLRYLSYKAGLSALSARLADRVRGFWGELQQKLAGKPAAKDVISAMKPYLQKIKEAVQETEDEYTKTVRPLIAEVAADLANNKKLVPEPVADGRVTLRPWQHALISYREGAAKRAAELGELPVPDPEVEFGDDHYPAAGG